MKLPLLSYVCNRLNSLRPSALRMISRPMFSVLVPNNASDALRRFIEALFITHAQTKLNTDGHLDQLLFPDHDDSVTMNPNTSTTAASSSLIDEQQQQMDKGEEEVWCKNLVRRPSCV